MFYLYLMLSNYYQCKISVIYFLKASKSIKKTKYYLFLYKIFVALHAQKMGLIQI